MFPHSLLRCDWLAMGDTYVCLGITFICFVPGWFSVIRIGPKCQHKKISMPKCYLKTNQIHENPCRVRPWMEIEWQALIKRKTACTRGVLYWASLFDAPRGVINSNIRGLLSDDWTMQWGWKVYSGGHVSYWVFQRYAQVCPKIHVMLLLHQFYRASWNISLSFNWET